MSLTFDHPLGGFGADLQDAYDGACTYTITAYNITATATNMLGDLLVTNSAGSHVTFVGVLDPMAEINRITPKDSSPNSSVSYFLMGQIGLVTATAPTAPVLAIVPDRSGYTVQWPTNTAAFHVQVATNLLPTVIWQALSGSVQTVGGDYSQVIGENFGSLAFFRLANVSP